MRAVEFGFAISADDQDALVAQLAQQVAQQPERAAIGPVQIVGVEQQRLPSRDVGKDLRDCIEKQQPFFVRGKLWAFGKWTETRFNLRREFGDLRCSIAEEFTQLV